MCLTTWRLPNNSGDYTKDYPEERIPNVIIELVKKKHTVYHKDGSVWAKGHIIDGLPDGYWEWFRKDGTKMRSGYFKNNKQAGEWTTYNKKSQVVKITNFNK